MPYRKLQYPTYVKDTNLDVHIKVLKKAIIVNGEIMELNIINMFGLTFKDTIFEWGENFVHDNPNCTLEELEQTFSLCQKVLSMSWTFYYYVLRTIM